MNTNQDHIYGLRSHITKYFNAVAKQLLAQTRAASFLTEQSTVIGNAGEQSFRAFLRDHLPGRYGVGTGHIVSFLEDSAQVDTIIYDTIDCFKIPITKESTLYSIEGVYGAIEVKSSPKRRNMSQDVKGAIKNIVSIKKLLHQPFHFTSVPTFNRLSDTFTARSVTPGYKPVCAIVIIGCGSSFETTVKTFRKEIETYIVEIPDLLCVIDEKNYGLYGSDYEVSEGNISNRVFWREKCDSPGQTIALFVYWLLHKMILERVTEQPIFHNTEQTTIWPAVMAPIIPRMVVNRDESHVSWGEKQETRVFE